MTKRNKKRVIVSVLVVVLIAIVVFCVLLPYRHKTKAPTTTTSTSTNTENGSITGATQDGPFDQKDSTSSSDIATTPSTPAPSNSTNNSVAYDPNNSADSLYYLALKNTTDKNYAEAILNLSKAIELDPKQEDYYSKKAEAQVLAGDKNGAITTVEAGLIALPGNELLQNKLDIIRATVK